MPGIFAYVPTVPGSVVSVSAAIPNPLPSSATSDQYHSCGSAVTAGWTFDGNAFSTVINNPSPPAPSEIEAAAAALLAEGLAITCTSTPALNGTYSLSQATQTLLTETSANIDLSGGSFPGGASELPWADAAGGEHLIPSVALFKEFALAIAAFIGQIDVYVSSNGTIGTLPTSNAVTIA